jgi:hypothetical protein
MLQIVLQTTKFPEEAAPLFGLWIVSASLRESPLLCWVWVSSRKDET